MDHLKARNRVHGFMLGHTPANEEDTSGKVSKEIEHMFYGTLSGDLSGSAEAVLARASSLEIQEQWGIWAEKTSKNVACGSVRIRKTISYPIVDGVIMREQEKIEYVMTTKIKTPEWDNLEIPNLTSADNFAAFKLLAESGMVKHRYTYPVPGTDLKFEVDMFVRPGEDVTSMRYYPICKIDLEVPNKEMEIPAFPEGFTDVFNAKLGEDATDAQKEIVEQMKAFLSLPNPHLEPRYKGL